MMADVILVDEFVTLTDWVAASNTTAAWAQTTLRVKHSGAALWISSQGQVTPLRRPAPGMHPGGRYTMLAWVYKTPGRVRLAVQADNGSTAQQTNLLQLDGVLEDGWNRLALNVEISADWEDSVHLRFWRSPGEEEISQADTYWCNLRVLEQEGLL